MTGSLEAGLDTNLARRERMDAIGELVKRLSHDYNNLFGIVLGAVTMLRDELEERSELTSLKPLIDDAISASQEGAELMNCLLACIGRLAAPKPSEVEPLGLMQTLVAEAQQTLPDKVVLDTALDRNGPKVMVDPEAFNRSVSSLVANALEAMPDGGTLRITSSGMRPDGSHKAQASLSPERLYLVVSVSDSGDGIDPVAIARIFEPFFTTKQPARERGLGLSLAYGFALHSGGDLIVESPPGEGATASLWIPAVLK